MSNSNISIKDKLISCINDYKSKLDIKIRYEQLISISYYTITNDFKIFKQNYPTACDNADVKYALAFPNVRYTPFNSYYDISDSPAIFDNNGNILNSIIHGKWELRFCSQSFTSTPNKVHFYIVDLETGHEFVLKEIYWFTDAWSIFVEVSSCNNIREAIKAFELFQKNKLLKEKVNALEIAQIECDDLRKAIREYQSILNEIKQHLSSLKNA
jgi:hypothetical protein